MSRLCILHIGMHKTGSTAIQRSFHGYDDGKMAYLPMPHPNHSFWTMRLFPGRMTDQFIEDEHGGNAEDFARRCQATAGQVLDLITGTDRDIIISAEELSGAHSPQTAREVRDFLAPHFDRFKVVGYVRQPAAFMESSFQEVIKKRFIAFRPDQLYPDYRLRLEQWDQVFGQSNVELVPFDRSALFEGDSVRDFARRIGADPARIKPRLANESLSAEAVALLFRLRLDLMDERIPAGKRRDLEASISPARKYGKTPFALHPDAIRQVLSEKADDIGWMEERLGGPLPPYRAKSGAALFGSEADLLAYADRTMRAFRLWRLSHRMMGRLKPLEKRLRRLLGKA